MSSAAFVADKSRLVRFWKSARTFFWLFINPILPIHSNSDANLAKWEFELTAEIEGMFGVFRTFIRRMYHHVSQEKFADYVREFCARFSSPELFISPSHFLAKTIRPVPFD